MKRYQSFNEAETRVEDLNYMRDGLEEAVRDRMAAVFTPAGVLRGFLAELEVFTDEPDDLTKVYVRNGVAYIQGERAQVSVQAEVLLDMQAHPDVSIYVEYALAADPGTQEIPGVQQDDQGVPHQVWYQDGVGVGWIDYPGGVLPSTRVLLARVQVVENQLQITDTRVYLAMTLPLADGSVDTPALAFEAVTSAKIASNSVSAAKLQTGSVTGTKIGTGAVINEKIENGAVDANKLADEAVTGPKLETGAVTSGKIATGAVTQTKISTAAVTPDKLALESVTEAKLAPLTDVVLIHAAFEESEASTFDPTTQPLGPRYEADETAVLNKLAGLFAVVDPTGPIRRLRAAYHYHLDESIAADTLKVTLKVWPYGYYAEMQEATGVVHAQGTEGEETLEVQMADFIRNGRYVFCLTTTRVSYAPETLGWIEDVAVYGMR